MISVLKPKILIFVFMNYTTEFLCRPHNPLLRVSSVFLVLSENFAAPAVFTHFMCTLCPFLPYLRLITEASSIVIKFCYSCTICGSSSLFDILSGCRVILKFIVVCLKTYPHATGTCGGEGALTLYASLLLGNTSCDLGRGLFLSASAIKWLLVIYLVIFCHHNLTETPIQNMENGTKPKIKFSTFAKWHLLIFTTLELDHSNYTTGRPSWIADAKDDTTLLCIDNIVT
jgi:hypothetical protein